MVKNDPIPVDDQSQMSPAQLHTARPDFATVSIG
jgi:hypothetical protein